MGLLMGVLDVSSRAWKRLPMSRPCHVDHADAHGVDVRPSATCFRQALGAQYAVMGASSSAS